MLMHVDVADVSQAKDMAQAAREEGMLLVRSIMAVDVSRDGNCYYGVVVDEYEECFVLAYYEEEIFAYEVTPLYTNDLAVAFDTFNNLDTLANIIW